MVKTRASRVNTESGSVINTVEIKNEYEDEKGDEFDTPYQIQAGLYYHVEGVEKGREGKPTTMYLKDYNGDGKAQECALYDADGCMALSTMLVGYSERQDRVILYPVRMSVLEDGKRSTEADAWAAFLFAEKPKRPGYWSYEIDSRGREGTLDKYEVQYNAQAEEFEGEVVRIPAQ